MGRDKKISIAIAELSPVILSGFSTCLRKLDNFQISLQEMKSASSLMENVSKRNFDIVIINPTLGNNISPNKIKELSINKNVRILAIEISKLPSEIIGQYDGSLSVTDNIETISNVIENSFLPPNVLNEEREILSTREKEIISLVAKGLTNQEIADKLYLSVHTVITHRRNIAKKLEIHSATGLTIYAIVNKIVDISDIKL